MTTYIYARVSTTRQETDCQVNALAKKYPGATVIWETASGAKQRPKLDALIALLAPGDTVVVWAIDRLGRGTVDVLTKVEAIVARGAALLSDTENVDYGGASGVLVVQFMASIAQFERSRIRERVKMGLQRAKDNGAKLGRAAKYTEEQKRQAVELCSQGHSVRAIAERLDVPKTVVGKWCKRTGHLSLVGS